MPTLIDKRRLSEGNEANILELADTPQELGKQIRNLGEAILAMQSLDDLASIEANDSAWDMMIGLQNKRNRAKEKLRNLTIT